MLIGMRGGGTPDSSSWYPQQPLWAVKYVLVNGANGTKAYDSKVPSGDKRRKTCSKFLGAEHGRVNVSRAIKLGKGEGARGRKGKSNAGEHPDWVSVVCEISQCLGPARFDVGPVSHWSPIAPAYPSHVLSSTYHSSMSS